MALAPKVYGSFLLGAALALAAPARAQGTASVPVQKGAPGGDVVAAISLSPADGISSMEFVLAYDPSVVAPTGAYTTGFTANYSLQPELRPPDRVSLALTGPVLQGSGEVAWIAFHVLGSTGASSAIAWRTCTLNGGLVPCTTQDGRINVAGAGVTVSVPDDAQGSPASAVTVPVSATAFTGVESIDLTLTYDPTTLQATSVAKTPLTSPLTLTFNVGEPGIARISLFGTAAIAGSGPLANVTFTVVGGLSRSTPLNLTKALFNEGVPSSVMDDGHFLACSTVDGDGDGQSSCAGDCNDADPAVFQGAVEVCDGKDNDCNGWVDDAPAPSGRPSISLSRQGATATLSWGAVPFATAYDVVRGGLGVLRSTAGDFAAATDGCVANDLVATTIDDATGPPIADGYWYLVRAVNCGGAGSYDEGATSQTSPRDAGIARAADTCP